MNSLKEKSEICLDNDLVFMGEKVEIMYDNNLKIKRLGIKDGKSS